MTGNEGTRTGTGWASYFSKKKGGGGPRLFARLEDMQWCGIELTAKNIAALQKNFTQAEALSKLKP